MCVRFTFNAVSSLFQLGFNGGNSPQAYEFVPFPQNPRVSLLPTMGWGNDIVGRYYFTIDEELEPGVCVDKELDPNLPDRMVNILLIYIFFNVCNTCL